MRHRSYKSNYLPTHGKGKCVPFKILFNFYTIEKRKKSIRVEYYLHFTLTLGCCAMILGVPTVVKTNILIRSMGPISELDMVNEI